VASGNPADPIAVEVGWWDGERWEGDWRYDDSAGNWAKADPIGWAPVPEIDQTFIAGLTTAALKASVAKLDAKKPKPLPAKGRQAQERRGRDAGARGSRQG